MVSVHSNQCGVLGRDLSGNPTYRDFALFRGTIALFFLFLDVHCPWHTRVLA
jgi:hypothetical protein